MMISLSVDANEKTEQPHQWPVRLICHNMKLWTNHVLMMDFFVSHREKTIESPWKVRDFLEGGIFLDSIDNLFGWWENVGIKGKETLENKDISHVEILHCCKWEESESKISTQPKANTKLRRVSYFWKTRKKET